jgi:hypothetical protein
MTKTNFSRPYLNGSRAKLLSSVARRVGVSELLYCQTLTLEFTTFTPCNLRVRQELPAQCGPISSKYSHVPLFSVL